MPGQPPLTLADERGLICSFLLHPQQAPKSLEWQSAMDAFENQQSIWLHFNQSDLRARSWIAGCDRIPQQCRDLLLAHAPRI